MPVDHSSLWQPYFQQCCVWTCSQKGRTEVTDWWLLSWCTGAEDAQFLWEWEKTSLLCMTFQRERPVGRHQLEGCACPQTH